MTPPPPPIQTEIWFEEAEPDNPYATHAAYCRGYDVFGEMVGGARWVEMLFLLFQRELPPPPALELLEALAVGLANPGPRDPAVHAAMSGGVAGSPAAASLMAALAVGAGRHAGARDVFDAMTLWAACGTDLSAWERNLNQADEGIDIWPEREHAPGFDPNGTSAPLAIRLFLSTLASLGDFPRLRWLADHREALESVAGMPLSIAGIAAAALSDAGFAPPAGEMLYLLLRLPGAAAHALEQEPLGYRRFPFPPIVLEDDPAGRENT